MELHCWPSKWGLASFDYTSLSILTYIRFSKAPVHIRPLSATKWHVMPSRLEQLPCLHHAKHRVHGQSAILEYLRKENYGIEYDFSETQLVQLRYLSAMIEKFLEPAILALLWLNANVMSEMTRPAYGQAAGLPASLLLPANLFHAAKSQVLKATRFWPAETSEERAETNGRRAITMLSYLLGQQAYFLGSKPSAIDAQVFALLCLLLRAPIAKSNRLLVHLKQCTNLENYCYRLQRDFFPEYSKMNSCNDTASISNDNSNSCLSARSLLSHMSVLKMAAFGSVVAASFFLYGYTHNLFRIEVFFENEDGEDKTDKVS